MLISTIDVETTGPVFALLITSPEVAGEVVSWFGVAVESASAKLVDLFLSESEDILEEVASLINVVDAFVTSSVDGGSFFV